MAASSITTIKHHNKLNNAEPIKQDPSKFYYHFLYKSLMVTIFLIILPLFPSQAPEFINQSLLTRNWELLHLLFVGIAISYGLFCRRNGGTDKDNNNNNNNSKFDTAQSYVSRFLQVSSCFEDDSENETPPSGDDDDDEDGKIQTWNNNYQYHRNEPVVVLAPKKYSNSNPRISEKPLLLPIRSLKSRVCDHFPAQSVNESNPTSVSVNGSGSESGSRRFSRNAEMEGSGSGRPTMEDRSKDNNKNVVLPSPIPWRSESLMKLQNSRISRPKPVTSSTSLSSPKIKDQSLESVAKNSEDTMKNKGFYKSSNIPLPPPPPPPMFFKSISVKERTSLLKNQAVPSEKDMKRSFTTIERNDKQIRGFYFENNNDEEEEEQVMEEKPGRKTTKASVGFADEEEKVMMAFDEDIESEEEGGGGGNDEAGRNTIAENEANNNEEHLRTEQVSGVGEEGPDVDKKADEFIAKFREQIRLQRIDSIKRSANRMARNSSR